MGAAERVVVDSATDYARRVAAGEILAGPWVRLAAKRHLQDLETGAARGLVWHPELAEHAIQFIECLRHYQGHRSPASCSSSRLAAVRRRIVLRLVRVDGQRRFRIAYVEIGKGNGKTPLAAAVALYGLVADGEAGAEVYSAATSREQAGICFNDAKQFVLACPPLLNRLQVGHGNIAYLATSSFLRTVSAEGRGLDGKRPHIVVVDELHEHPTAQVVEKMRAGTKGRTRALIFEITNSGYDQTTVCFEHHDYSIKVLQGVIENDSVVRVRCGARQGRRAVRDEACWIKANPNVGVSLTLQYLREQVREAKDIPSKRNLVLRLNFCRWTEASKAGRIWTTWDRCATPVQASALAKRKCYGGPRPRVGQRLHGAGLGLPAGEEGGLWETLLRLYLPEARYARCARRSACRSTRGSRRA
jgi:phage terminase large subunit-like protein